MVDRRVPVMVRGGLQGVPMASPKRATKSQRRMDIPLSMPGAEIRLPSIPAIGFSWRIVSGTLSLFLILIFYLLWTSPVFRIADVTVTGLNRITLKDVNLELNLEDHPIFTVDPQAITAKITKLFPEFSQVNLEVRLPNKVFLNVVERTPMLVWKQDGRTLLIDANGYAFPVRGQSTNLPKLTIEAHSAPLGLTMDNVDSQAARFLPADMVSGILSLNALLPDGAVLVYDQEHGLGWKDKRGWDVYFGEINNISLKMKIYNMMVSKLKKEDIKPILISVEYVHAPYYRTER
jgi:hypothetical protein